MTEFILHSQSSRRPSAILLVATAAMLIWPAQAEAQYLDPGAASIIVQAVVAGVVAVAASLKFYWSRIASLFSRRRQPEEGPEER